LSGRLGHSRHARTLRGWLPLFLCAWCGLSTSFVAGQAGGVEWDVPDTLTADDRRDILEIARRTGIDDPHRSWFVDVALGRGVDSETAERIVRAARLGQFVERCRQNRSLRHAPATSPPSR
jgi:hypothetical protein